MSALCLQALCLTTTPYRAFLGALTAEEHDRPAYMMDSAWFQDLQNDLVLVQLLWPDIVRPSPPRDIICDNFLAVANTPGDQARSLGLVHLDADPQSLHAAICWILAATCRRRDWAPPPVPDDAIEASISSAQTLLCIPAHLTARAAQLLPRRFRQDRVYLLTSSFLLTAAGFCPRTADESNYAGRGLILPADCWPATALAWDLASTSPVTLREAAHRLSTRVAWIHWPRRIAFSHAHHCGVHLYCLIEDTQWAPAMQEA